MVIEWVSRSWALNHISSKNVEFEAEFFIRPNRTPDDIQMIVSSLGLERVNNPKELEATLIFGREAKATVHSMDAMHLYESQQYYLQKWTG